jgi:hypothetical protein
MVKGEGPALSAFMEEIGEFADERGRPFILAQFENGGQVPGELFRKVPNPCLVLAKDASNARLGALDHPHIKGFTGRRRGSFPGGGLFPDVELQLPTVRASCRLAPKFQGAHFGESNRKLHGKPLSGAFLSVPEHGPDGGEARDLVFGEADEVAEVISETGEGGKQPEAYRLIGDDFERQLLQLRFETFLGASRNKTDGF